MVLATPDYQEKRSHSSQFMPFLHTRHMISNSLSPSPKKHSSRYGFHYFPDTVHYRESDLLTWLPELQALDAGWLVLRSELDRAIPEYFLRGLKTACIEPVIQFQIALDRLPDSKEAGTLLEVYARWGARYVIFFDKPNARAAWAAAGWVQQDLVERFLDHYLPLANLAVGLGLVPVFPPLEPGGDYWDTAFLSSVLQNIQRRRQEAILTNLVLSAYAWTGGHSLDWGAGGPDRWPKARPYQSVEYEQDQRGFRIFDWYQAVVQNALQQVCPIILLQAGLPADPIGLPVEVTQTPGYAKSCASIARMMAGEPADDPNVEGTVLAEIPPEVIACNFWLLSAGSSDPFAAQAWFQEDNRQHALVSVLRENARERKARQASVLVESSSRPIQHYLLLPGSEWGVSDWYLEVIRPFVKKHRPTIGFSVDEAGRASRVTVVGNALNYPEDLIDRLQNAGCFVEQISGDGTNIATQLAER